MLGEAWTQAINMQATRAQLITVAKASVWDYRRCRGVKPRRQGQINYFSRSLEFPKRQYRVTVGKVKQWIHINISYLRQ